MFASNIQLTAKKSHYNVDGTGRDSYINANNGGNYRGFIHEGTGKFQRGTFVNERRFRLRSTYVEGRPLHYIGNGTGRDSYIISNQGGIAKNQNKVNFLQSLRTPIARNEYKKSDTFSRTQDSWYPYRRNASSISQQQKNLDKKLSTPRQYNDPYKEMRSTFSSSIRSSSKSK